MTRSTTDRARDVMTGQDPEVAPATKLAEPPIPGGRVEAMMGVLIRALSPARWPGRCPRSRCLRSGSG